MINIKLIQYIHWNAKYQISLECNISLQQISKPFFSNFTKQWNILQNATFLYYSKQQFGKIAQFSKKVSSVCNFTNLISMSVYLFLNTSWNKCLNITYVLSKKLNSLFILIYINNLRFIGQIFAILKYFLKT